MTFDSPHGLLLDGQALVANWRWLARRGGRAACGAAIKADGYGLGARDVALRLAQAGCRDFFVATWAEAAAVAPVLQAAAGGVSLSVLHGVRDEDMALALSGIARPVLNTPQQIARWRAADGGLCHVMVDTGMNRLGLSAADVTSGAMDGLSLDVVMSHLACADEPGHAMNERQRKAFVALTAGLGARRRSLCNSAGILLGGDYHFDLTRPGIALYGGVQVDDARGHIAQVVTPRAQLLQTRMVSPGESVGYNATFTAERPMRLGVLNLGYADGYLRGFSGTGRALHDGTVMPVIGRISMDLTAIDISAAPDLGEGDWISIDFAMPWASETSGLSQYELLTGLGGRYQRQWI